MNRLPPSVQAEDLIQAGMIGLIEASRNYDPSQGQASRPMPASASAVRCWMRYVVPMDAALGTPQGADGADAMREIENAEGRDARDVEVAESLGMSIEDYHQVLQDASVHASSVTRNCARSANP